jgi:hypothetical protein
MLVNAKRGIWCDYCKLRWGSEKREIQGIGIVPRDAAWTIHSELPQSNGRVRHLCQDCAIDVSRWADGTFFPLPEQIAYALKNQPKQEALNGF